MNDEQLKQYYSVYAEAWKLFRKYSNPTGDDQFWELLDKEAQELYKKFDTEFMKDVLVCTINEIDRIYKRSVKNGKG